MFYMFYSSFINALSPELLCGFYSIQRTHNFLVWQNAAKYNKMDLWDPRTAGWRPMALLV